MNVAHDPPSQAPPTPNQYVPPAAPVITDPRRKSSVLAFILSAVLPGTGQVYVGYYQRGFIHAIVVAIGITIMSSEPPEEMMPLFALPLVFFWFYNAIDAGRRASLYNQVLAGGTNIELPEDLKMPGIGGSIAGGLALIGIGSLLLLNTRFGFSLDWLEEWWPVAVIGFGIYLLVKALKDRADEAGASHEA